MNYALLCHPLEQIWNKNQNGIHLQGRPGMSIKKERENYYGKEGLISMKVSSVL